MGAWGYDPLENDDGLDWFLDFEETGTADARDALIGAALEACAAPGYLEVTTGGAALVAVSLVAGLTFPDRPSAAIAPREVARWRARYGRTALSALERVSALGVSELADLDESGGFAPLFKELRSRLVHG